MQDKSNPLQPKADGVHPITESCELYIFLYRCSFLWHSCLWFCIYILWSRFCAL